MSELIGIAFDKSEVHSLLSDLRTALDRTANVPGPLRGGFRAAASKAIIEPTLGFVRDVIDNALKSEPNKRRTAKKVVYQRRGKDVMEVGKAEETLQRPPWPKRLFGGSSRGKVFTSDMVTAEVSEDEVFEDGGSGFTVGIGNIKKMDQWSTVESVNRKKAFMWRVLDEGAKESDPYSPHHVSPTGKPGWFATYQSGPNWFRLWVPQEFINPAREGKHFFRQIEGGMASVMRQFMPQVSDLFIMCIDNIWQKTSVGVGRPPGSKNSLKSMIG